MLQLTVLLNACFSSSDTWGPAGRAWKGKHKLMRFIRATVACTLLTSMLCTRQHVLQPGWAELMHSKTQCNLPAVCPHRRGCWARRP